MRAAILWVLVTGGLFGCTKDPVAPEFASPSATITTLFTTYDLADVPQTEIRRRFEAGERFKLLNPTLFQSCFSDWQGEHDEGLGGFVFGQLVVAKDELVIEVDEDVARVRPKHGPEDLPPVLLVRQDAGWKIDLRQSIPAEIRQRLYEVNRRARRVERQAR
ncbi:MAG: hypothetical protein AAF500_11110 [Myxococcota bacterium]